MEVEKHLQVRLAALNEFLGGRHRRRDDLAVLERLNDLDTLGGRAERAAANTKENFILFIALAFAAQASGIRA